MGFFSKTKRSFSRAVRRGGSATKETVKATGRGDFKTAFIQGTEASLASAQVGSGLGASFTKTEKLVDVGSGSFGFERNASGKLVKASGSSGSGLSSGRLAEAAQLRAADEATRQSRLRRARTVRRGGTVSVTSLGSPLGGVGLTRPTLGRG